MVDDVDPPGYYLRHGLGILNVIEQGMDNHGPNRAHEE